MSIFAVHPPGDAPPTIEIKTKESEQITDVLCRAERAAHLIADLEGQLKSLRQNRDQAVVELSNAGIPRSRIAQVVDLSKQRVGQLISAIRSGVAS